jgi:DNA-binding NarL/FixJ family response regulator
LAPILILLLKLPSTVRDALKEVLADQADMQVVNELSDPMEVLLAVGQTGADVVILGMEDGKLPGIASHLLDQYPHIKILAISTDGRHLFLYELRPELAPIGEMEPHRLIHAIRAALQEGSWGHAGERINGSV